MKKPQNIVQKILGAHLLSGEMTAGSEIAIRIDQTLTQDATGTMAYLQFEAMGVPRVRTQLSVSYIDHNTLQSGYQNADDHRFLRTIAAKHGIRFSPPGNGICHQVHLEKFGLPGKTLLGSDSHTPTGGGIGMIAIGAGGLDVAVAMAGGPFYLSMPRVLRVNLKGKLRPWVSAKDVILELLRRLTVRGGVGWMLEYGGPGVASLSVPERATITNMGAELGCTTSIFPSDERTREFMKSVGRVADWKPLAADPGASYDKEITVDLSTLEPMVALPHSPDNVVPVREVAGKTVDQVGIGSCTNSSLKDMMTTAAALRKKHVAPTTDLIVLPGSRQVLEALVRSGGLADMVAAGARVMECVCGPCIGMGMAPPTDGVTLRTFNRNFEGRSGTPSAGIYLCSPETAVASALTGKITDPRTLGKMPRVALPALDPSALTILEPSKKPDSVKILRGPNIKPLPKSNLFPEDLEGEILLKVGDNITTDHIMPAGAKILPLRSNIPAIAEHVFEAVDGGFAARAKQKGGGIIAGGSNYGQGSSREHAALAPKYLGVRAVFAASFARIHRANLVNFGILPLIFENPKDLASLKLGDKITIKGAKAQLLKGNIIEARAGSKKIALRHDLSARERDVILAGGLLNHTKKTAGKKRTK